jgi:2',3'-cyclic-nucleotide 2'-phosphodiesterase (5'-nucleotidase family)
MLNRFAFLLLIPVGLWGCQPTYHLTGQQTARLPVDSTTARPDTATARFLEPYRQKLDATMNAVLTRTTARLEKSQPESALGDILTDALLQQAQTRYAKPIDLAHINFGGIRNGLPLGNVTTGHVFEIMPFDNALLVLTLTGAQLQQFLNHFAGEGPVVSGVRLRVKNRREVTVLSFTNGRTFQPDQTYTLAVSDYVANGGSGAEFLKAITARQDLNYLMRDALLDYFRKQGQTNQPLPDQPDGRITAE